jgi:hypothetical protein
MLDNSHLSLFLNLLGLGLEVIGFAWILTKEIKCKDQQPKLLRSTQHLDDIESPIIKLVDLERQAVNDLDNTMSAPITDTSYISDKMPGTKHTGMQYIALGFFIQLGALFF